MKLTRKLPRSLSLSEEIIAKIMAFHPEAVRTLHGTQQEGQPDQADTAEAAALSEGTSVGDSVQGTADAAPGEDAARDAAVTQWTSTDAAQQARPSAEVAADTGTLPLADDASSTVQSADTHKGASDLTNVSEDGTRAAAFHDKQEAIRQALTEAGVNKLVIELMLREVPTESVSLHNGRLADAAAVLAPLKAKYGGLFGTTRVEPVPSVTPPLSGSGALSTEEIARMSMEDINRHWGMVKAALSRKR